MLSYSEILNKINASESSGVEFKEVKITSRKVEPHPDGLSDEITAFANQKGGLIIFGVRDDKQILGINHADAKTLIQLIGNICHDIIKPALVDFYIDSLNILDEKTSGKNLIYMEISRSLWLHESKNGYFYRHADSKRKMSIEHILRLGQSRSQARIIPFDEQLVPSTQLETLEKSLYQRFIPNEINDDETNNFLLKRYLLIEDKNYYRATVAGLLMCSQHSDEYLYNSFICAVCYSGTTKDANYQIDAQDFKGTLDQQIVDAFAFVKKHNQVSALKEVGRIDQAQYSMKAIFEAIVNAVVHRDYSKYGSKIRLFMFKDRLELYSPGALANSLTVENLRYNQMSRNELLGRLLSELTLNDKIAKQVARKYFLERRAEGVGIILKESLQLSGRKAVYKMFGEELRLTIFAAKSLQEK